MFLKNNSDRFCSLCKNPPVASHQSGIQGSSPWPAGPAQSLSLLVLISHLSRPPWSSLSSLPAVPHKLQPPSHSWTRVLLPLNHQLSDFAQLSSHVTVSDHSACSGTVLLFSKQSAEKMSFDVFTDCFLLKGIFCLKINFLFYQFYILNGKSELDFKRLSLDSFFIF